MEKIYIFCDSAGDIPREEVEQYGIDIVPERITHAGHSFREYYDMTPEQYWDLLESSDEIPTTAQVTPALAMECYERARAAGCTHVVGAIINAAGSGGYQSCSIARAMFYEKYGEGERAEARRRRELPDEDTERMMYQFTKNILWSYGYHRYEISNYAKEGYECRHNLGYWNRTEYLGIGTGAASLINNQRFVEGGEIEVLSLQNQMEEYMFLGLRKIEGVSKTDFRQTFGRSIENAYGKVLIDMYQKQLLEDTGEYIRLTEKGIDVSNYVMSEFLF